MKIRSVFLLTSAYTLEQCPAPEVPEFAFVGRSNVGKSSLINSLLQRRIAKTSNTPGKTRLMNYYSINNAFFLVDLPGYGYAKVSKDDRHLWQTRLRKYLEQRTRLLRVFHLIDSRHGPLPVDAWMTDVLVDLDLPRAAILTKTDKIGRQDFAKVRRVTAAGLAVPLEKTIGYALPDVGRDDVLQLLRNDLKQEVPPASPTPFES